MKINLPKDKHIAIILEPRSGSSVFRNYISSSLGHIDLKEMMNPLHPQTHMSIDKNTKTVSAFMNSYAFDNIPIYNTEFDEIVLDDWANKNLTMLNDMASIERFAIFSLMIKNILCDYPDIIKKIKNNANMHFIRLKRMDVLYGIISIEICGYTNIWHNKNQEHTFSRVNIKNKFNLPLDWIKFHLDMYIKCEGLIREIFGNVPVLYYEQWQNNIRNLNKIIDLPNKLVSVEYQKFVGNYKDLISNIDEIEDYYKEFVNNHSEYFQDEHVKNVLSNSINEFY
jgi:hypothetical protein